MQSLLKLFVASNSPLHLVCSVQLQCQKYHKINHRNYILLEKGQISLLSPKLCWPAQCQNDFLSTSHKEIHVDPAIDTEKYYLEITCALIISF